MHHSGANVPRECRVTSPPLSRPAKAGASDNRLDRGRMPIALLDDVVGAGEDRLRDRQSERLRGLEIDRKIESGRQLDRQIGGLASLQNLVDVDCRLTKLIVGTARISHEAA